MVDKTDPFTCVGAVMTTLQAHYYLGPVGDPKGRHAPTASPPPPRAPSGCLARGAEPTAAGLAQVLQHGSGWVGLGLWVCLGAPWVPHVFISDAMPASSARVGGPRCSRSSPLRGSEPSCRLHSIQQPFQSRCCLRCTPASLARPHSRHLFAAAGLQDSHNALSAGCAEMVADGSYLANTQALDFPLSSPQCPVDTLTVTSQSFGLNDMAGHAPAQPEPLRPIRCRSESLPCERPPNCVFANCVFACRVFIMQGAGLMLAVIIRCTPERWVKRPQWLQERKDMKKEEREMKRNMSTAQRAGSTGGGSAAGHVQSSAARVSFVMAERAAEQRRAVSKARMAVLLKMVAQGVALEPRPAQHPMHGLRAAPQGQAVLGQGKPAGRCASVSRVACRGGSDGWRGFRSRGGHTAQRQRQVECSLAIPAPLPLYRLPLRPVHRPRLRKIPEMEMDVSQPDSAPPHGSQLAPLHSPSHPLRHMPTWAPSADTARTVAADQEASSPLGIGTHNRRSVQAHQHARIAQAAQQRRSIDLPRADDAAANDHEAEVALEAELLAAVVVETSAAGQNGDAPVV